MLAQRHSLGSVWGDVCTPPVDVGDASERPEVQSQGLRNLALKHGSSRLGIGRSEGPLGTLTTAPDLGPPKPPPCRPSLGCPSRPNHSETGPSHNLCLRGSARRALFVFGKSVWEFVPAMALKARRRMGGATGSMLCEGDSGDPEPAPVDPQHRPPRDVFAGCVDAPPRRRFGDGLVGSDSRSGVVGVLTAQAAVRDKHRVRGLMPRGRAWSPTLRPPS